MFKEQNFSTQSLVMVRYKNKNTLREMSIPLTGINLNWVIHLVKLKRERVTYVQVSIYI